MPSAMNAAPFWTGALATGGSRGRGRWAWAPVALHVVEVARVGGDWMGRGRLLLPAFVALAASAPVGRRSAGRAGWALLLLSVPTVLVEAHLPSGDSSGLVVRSWAPSRATFDFETPLRGDVEWLVRRPRGGTSVATRDVGMPLLATWVQVRDQVGLVDTEVALAVSGLGSTRVPPADCRRSSTPDPGWVFCCRACSATRVWLRVTGPSPRLSISRSVAPRNRFEEAVAIADTISADFCRNRSRRFSSTSPSSMPSGVSRRSALS